jgi:hydroxymethylbilane synthase
LDKGFFVNEIQKLLIEQKIDIAVHSLKDLPVENDDGLKISAILKRGNPQDVFLSKSKKN